MEKRKMKRKSKEKVIKRWNRLRDFVRSGAFLEIDRIGREVLPDVSMPSFIEVVQAMERMDTREKTFFEKATKTNGKIEVHIETDGEYSKADCHCEHEVNGHDGNYVNGYGTLTNECQSCKDETTADDFDFDENENVRIVDIKSTVTPRPKYSKTVDVYRVACFQCKVIALSNFLKQLTSYTVDISGNMLTYKDVKPMAIALANDQRVLTLNVSNNNIGSLGSMYLAEMLTHNTKLTELLAVSYSQFNLIIKSMNLAGTIPGREGLEALAATVQYNNTIRVLRLESNGIQHTEMRLIIDIIENLKSLKELYLGHNCLGYDGGTELGKTLATNDTLKVLDLRWNHLRRESAVEISKALAQNKTLRTLDLSWNGWGKEGCIALSNSLPKNSTLADLNLTSNRIDMLSLRFLLHGIVRNTSLTRIQIGRNPMTTDGAKAVIKALDSSKSSVLREDIPVDDEFVQLLKKLQEKKTIRFEHGEKLASGLAVITREHDPNDLNRFEPVMVLVEYMRIDNLRLIDFFQYMDTSNRGQLSKSDLRDGVANLSLPFTEHHLDLIMEKVDIKRDGMIDLEEFMMVHRETSRLITQRTTKAKAKHKEDQGLATRRVLVLQTVCIYKESEIYLFKQ
ncbi:hypothetical protein KUTeg_024804 [Tegillarca granosa]|uniref:EF-hand domain-containing protein n=1 Tax=Tegillarca granosa TaxID=220873 RepID=A0ABQ9E4N7_TEGGR|nr:hypothetical protein KUTeg_024804 [Tegillarca granosa]